MIHGVFSEYFVKRNLSWREPLFIGIQCRRFQRFPVGLDAML